MVSVSLLLIYIVKWEKNEGEKEYPMAVGYSFRRLIYLPLIFCYNLKFLLLR